MKSHVFHCLLLFCFSFTQAQSKIESTEELKNWLPSTLEGYTAETDSYAAELQQDGLPYFMAAKKYVKGNATLSVVIFDYRKVSERIRSITSDWDPNKRTDDDTIYSSNTMIDGCKAQELVDKTKKTALLYLYHADRYLLTISSSSENIDFLKTVAHNLPLTNLTN